MGTSRPALSDTFEANCKMAASEGERSISTILRKKRKGTVKSLSMSQLVIRNYLTTLTKGSCNKTVFLFIDSAGSTGSAAPRFRGL